MSLSRILASFSARRLCNSIARCSTATRKSLMAHNMALGNNTLQSAASNTGPPCFAESEPTPLRLEVGGEVAVAKGKLCTCATHQITDYFREPPAQSWRSPVSCRHFALSGCRLYSRMTGSLWSDAQECNSLLAPPPPPPLPESPVN